MRVLAVLSLVLALACDRRPPATATPASPQPVAAAPTTTAAEPTQPHRGLTAGERALLLPLFRDAIDYDAVRIVDGTAPFQPPGAYVTVGSFVYAPGALFRADFSARGVSMLDRAIFVHEMAHVWQHGNGMDLVVGSVVEMVKYRGRYDRAYAYRLEPGRDLLAYGMEQQASIVEDYFRITTQKSPPWSLENRGLSARERLRLYRDVLGKFLTDPGYARAGK